MKPIRYDEEMKEFYTQKGYWNSSTMADFWDQNAREIPDKEAFADCKSRLTWSQAKGLAHRLALVILEMGVKREEVVVTQLPNWVEAFLIRNAGERAGFLHLPAMVTLRYKEMEYVLQKTEAVAVVIPKEFHGFSYWEMIQELRTNLPSLRYILVAGSDVPPGAISLNELLGTPVEDMYPQDYLDGFRANGYDVVWLHMTSGTTGVPKLLEWPGNPSRFSAQILNQRIRMTAEDVIGVIKPNPNFNNYDLSSLRVIIYAGAVLPYEAALECEARFGCPVMTVYGAIDTGYFSLHSLDDPPEVRLATAGKLWTGNEFKLLDDEGKEVPPGEVGEVWTRGPHCISGFFGDTELTREVWGSYGLDGWARVGDLAKFDEEGNVVLVGRKDDMILRGGMNIYPGEIEAILVTHPKVSNVAVVRRPDPLMGEKACAFVIPKAGQNFTFEEMLSFLKEKKIANFKLPERLEILGSFPMAGEAKVDKKALTALVTEKLKAEGKI